jgi:hypothetical protein
LPLPNESSNELPLRRAVVTVRPLLLPPREADEPTPRDVVRDDERRAVVVLVRRTVEVLVREVAREDPVSPGRPTKPSELSFRPMNEPSTDVRSIPSNIVLISVVPRFIPALPLLEEPLPLLPVLPVLPPCPKATAATATNSNDVNVNLCNIIFSVFVCVC